MLFQCDPARRSIHFHFEHRDRFGNVLDLLLAHRLEAEGEFLLDLLGYLARDADAAGFSKLLEPSCDVHAFTQAIVTLDDDFTKVDANADIDPLVFRHTGVALGETALQRHGALDGVHNARKLRKQSIASQLEDAAVVLLDFGLEQLFAVCP